MSTGPLYVRVVDPQSIPAQKLAKTLRMLPQVEVVAELPAGDLVSRATQRGVPDILMIAAAGPVAASVAMLQHERRQAPGIRMLAALAPDEVEVIPAFFDAGVTGFLREDAPADEFHTAARVVLDGGAYFSLSLIDALLATFRKDRSSPDIFGLTAREREILTLIAVNMSNKDIARKLDLSVRTVETHRLNIRKKTNAGNWRELAAIANRLGLLGDYPLPPGLAERPAAPGFHEK